MEIETVVKLLDDIDNIGISPRTFGAQTEYLASDDADSPRGKINPRALATNFETSEETVERVFRRLESLGVVDPVSEKQLYQVEFATLRTVVDRMEWIAEPVNREQTRRLFDTQPSEIQMITGSPREVDGIPHPNITGRLVDMVANASETVKVVNPFFTRDGLELLLDAFVGATERGVELDILTRDVNFGNGSNASDIRRLRKRIKKEGSPENLQVFEVAKERYPQASLHAKVTVVDRSRAYVGSANLTDQSLQNAVEIGLYLEDGPVGQITEYLEQCQSSKLFVPVED